MWRRVAPPIDPIWCNLPHMTTTEPTEYLTTAEVAAELRVNPETVRRWVRDGALPALPVGRGYRIARADFDALVAQLRTTTPVVSP